MDGFLLYTIVNELKNTVINQKVEKIHMPTRDEVHFILRKNRLKININSNDYSICLSKYAVKYPEKPFAMCMFLRKYLTNAIITDISMQGLERVVFIDFNVRDEMGEKRKLKLFAELMGRRSNIILTDESGVILECFRHAAVDENIDRVLLPGVKYLPPPKNKINPLDLDANEFAQIISNSSEAGIENILTAKFEGFSKKQAQEVVKLAKPVYTSEAKPSYSEAVFIAGKLVSFFDAFKRGEIYQTANPNENLDEYFHDKQLKSELNAKLNALKKSVNKHLDKRQKKLSSQWDTMLSASGAEKFRKYADLITVNLYRIPKENSDRITVEDYFNDLNEIEIPLDEKYSPQVNANRYYKKYNKLKTAKDITERNIAENEREIAYLEENKYLLETCETMDDAREIESDLIKYGYFNSKDNLKKTSLPPSEPLKFISSEGYEIYVGKNSRQNDLITMKTAKNNDLWLHAKGAGSHVILKLANEDIPEVSLIEASTLAGYFSNQRSNTKFEIDYTFRKNIKKPPGAKPGMVIYDTNYSLTAKNDEKILAYFGLSGSGLNKG